MIIINKDSKFYPIIADSIATFIGFGASVLVGGFCDSMIQTQNPVGIKKALMHSGKYGLEGMTIYSVAAQIRDELDEMVDSYNDLAEAMNLVKQKGGDE